MKSHRITPDWPGATVAIIGGGYSLSASHVEHLRGHDVRVIGINDAYRLAPWSDLHYACDFIWWKWHHDEARAAMRCPSLTQDTDAASRWADLVYIKGVNETGLSTRPDVIHTGSNSGFQALNIATLKGAARVLLLGFDMQPGPGGRQHWFGEHPHKIRSPYALYIRAFNGAADQLKAMGVDVVNCTPGSALECFPIMPIEEALA